MRLSLPTISLVTATAAAFALAVALASQHWMGLVPCPLCLLERWPWRAAIVLGLIAFVTPARIARPLLVLAAVVILADAAVAFVHVGVEHRLWPSPLPECQAPLLSGSIADRLRTLPAEPSASCQDALYLVPAIPISMATMDMAYALVVAAGLAILLLNGRRTHEGRA